MSRIVSDLPAAQRALTSPRQKRIILIESTESGYVATVAGHPEVWAAGRDVYQAVGDLIMHHEEAFGVRVLMPGEKP